ncbi:hypothetical protein N0V94_006610 [Neodidymelliopsis sp. IMI 364377]|nr:hypothetical protein N0V94_006610 [Neodidymelliopsis sp. IMI 364377]
MNGHMRSESLEAKPGHTPASRLLGPGMNTDDHASSAIAYTSPQAHENDIISSSNDSSAGKKSPHYTYKSVDTFGTDNSDSNAATRVLWKGIPVYALTWELLGVVIAVLFLILGAFVTNLRGQTESEWSKRVLQATRVAPSVWPILFSGVLGNTLRRFANWRAERGVSLLVWVTILDETNLVTNWLCADFGAADEFANLLIVLWAFNPLGSQASFRGIYLTDSIGHGTGALSYYNHNFTTQMGLSAFALSGSRALPTIRALYSAALYDVASKAQYVSSENATYKAAITSLGGPQAAGLQMGTDSWGNLRIPNLEYLNNYDSTHPYDWVSVPWKEQPQNYSSLVGDHIDGIDQELDSWSERYFGQNLSAAVSTFESTTLQVSTANPYSRTFFGLPSTSPGTYRNLSAPGHPQFFFGSLGTGVEGQEHASVTACTTGTTYIDMQVTCISRGSTGKANCGVDAIRKSLELTEPPDAGILEALRVDDPRISSQYDDRVAVGFLTAFMTLLDDNQIGSGQMSIVQAYIADPLTAFDRPVQFSYMDFSKVDVKLVEKRLSLLYNTLWRVGWSYMSMTGGNMTTSFESSRTGETMWTLANTTSQIVFPLEPVYELDVPWLIVYFVSVGVMFFAAFASLILHAMCHAPPVLGYVSSLIRDSVFFSESGVQGNSTEGGISKARRLGKMEVMVADVWSEESVGRVAFAPAEGKGVVKRKRWYD